MCGVAAVGRRSLHPAAHLAGALSCQRRVAGRPPLAERIPVRCRPVAPAQPVDRGRRRAEGASSRGQPAAQLDGGPELHATPTDRRRPRSTQAIDRRQYRSGRLDDARRQAGGVGEQVCLAGDSGRRVRFTSRGEVAVSSHQAPTAAGSAQDRRRDGDRCVDPLAGRIVRGSGRHIERARGEAARRLGARGRHRHGE